MLEGVGRAFRVLGRHKRREANTALIRELRRLASNRALVRYGPDADGGYLIPDDLEEIGGSISPGVSSECGFDLQIAQRGVTFHMADASVENVPVPHPNFKFSKVFLDSFNSDRTIRLDDYCADIAPGEDLLLQMDIEGAEYRVLHSATDAALNRFRIMVIEFHDLDSLFTSFGFREISSIFRRLLRTHAVVHIHPNNVSKVVSVGSISIPRIMEFTFYRRDRAAFQVKTATFSHPLDRRNVVKRPDVILPSLWHH